MAEERNKAHPIVEAVRAVVRFIVRLTLLVLLFAAVAAGLYYGIPYVERTFLEPLRQTQARVAALEAQLTQQAQDVQAMTQSLSRDIDALRQDLKALETSLQDVQEQLQQIEARQKDLQDQWSQAERDRKALAQDVRALQKDIDDLQARLQALDARLTEWETLWSSQAPALAETRRQALALRLMLHTLRAGLFLSQDNYGSARGEVALAVDFLQSQMPLVPDAERPQWNAVLEHLQTARAALPKQPIRAREALDAAWSQLSAIYGPETTASSLLTPTPEGATPQPTGTPTPTPTATPKP